MEIRQVSNMKDARRHQAECKMSTELLLTPGGSVKTVFSVIFASPPLMVSSLRSDSDHVTTCVCVFVCFRGGAEET